MILVCAATMPEMEACLPVFGGRFDGLATENPAASPAGPGPRGPSAGPDLAERGKGRLWVRRRGDILFAVTGVGIPLTLTRLLPLAAQWRPDFILNVGIAGAFPGSGLAIGDLVAGESETFGDLGMETPDSEGFLPLSAFPWADDLYRSSLPLTLEPLISFAGGEPADGAFSGSAFSGSAYSRDTYPGGSPAAAAPSALRTARGCTVNSCTGTEATGLRRETLTGAGFETMEGAAAALAGLELGIPVCEVRAISNIASTRDFRPANAQTALGNLGAYMGRWLSGRPEARIGVNP